MEEGKEGGREREREREGKAGRRKQGKECERESTYDGRRGEEHLYKHTYTRRYACEHMYVYTYKHMHICRSCTYTPLTCTSLIHFAVAALRILNARATEASEETGPPGICASSSSWLPPEF